MNPKIKTIVNETYNYTIYETINGAQFDTFEEAEQYQTFIDVVPQSEFYDSNINKSFTIYNIKDNDALELLIQNLHRANQWNNIYFRGQNYYKGLRTISLPEIIIQEYNCEDEDFHYHMLYTAQEYMDAWREEIMFSLKAIEAFEEELNEIRSSK